MKLIELLYMLDNKTNIEIISEYGIFTNQNRTRLLKLFNRETIEHNFIVERMKVEDNILYIHTSFENC